MGNLLKETTDAIADSGHDPADIVFIGSEESGHRCTWEEFTVLADREYDSGFGGAEVNTKLVIRFSDGQSMWRGEYDGNEWWEYSTPAPAEVPPAKPIKTLFTGWYDFDEEEGEG